MILHPTSTPRASAHRYAVRVYYEDTDAGGVVYHATYLRMAERARTEALRDLGVPHTEMSEQHGLSFMVRRVNLDYAAPARLDDLLEVTTRVMKLGSASLDLRQNFFGPLRAVRPIVVADVQLVCVRTADMRPVRIPDRWRAALASLATEED